MNDSEPRTAYQDIMSYIVSSAAAGEVVAIENYAQMLPLMPSLEEKLFTLAQASEEARHFRMLEGLGRDQGFSVVSDPIEPEWRAIREAFSEAAKRDDLVSCLLIQEVMVETLAIVLYSTLAARAITDPVTSKIAQTILDEEVEHLETGIAKLQVLAAAEPEKALASLIWSHDRVIPDLFSIATTDCDRLCDDLGVHCGSLDLVAIEVDLYDVRSEAADRYIETLDRIGFKPDQIHSIVASMSTFEAEPSDGRVSCC